MRSVPTTKFCPPLPREATTFTAGSDPGAATRPRKPYWSATITRPIRTPFDESSQPIGFWGRDRPMSPPMLT